MRSERLLGFLKKVENPMAQTGFISYTIFLKYPKAGHGLFKRTPPQETPLGFPLPDITILLSGIAVCFLAGVLGGLSGAGTGLVIAGFLVPIVGAKAVMPALAIIMLINNGSRIFYFFQSLNTKMVLAMVVLATPGSMLGAQLYVDIPVSFFEAALGSVILLVLSIKTWRRMSASPSTAQWKPKKIGWAMGPVSFLYGFINSIVPGSGVMVLAFLSATGMTTSAVIANDAAIAASLNLLKVLLFRQLDALPDPLILIAVVCGIASIPGVWFAKWLSTRLKEKVQHGIIDSVIALSAINLLFRAAG